MFSSIFGSIEGYLKYPLEAPDAGGCADFTECPPDPLNRLQRDMDRLEMLVSCTRFENGTSSDCRG